MEKENNKVKSQAKICKDFFFKKCPIEYFLEDEEIPVKNLSTDCLIN